MEECKNCECECHKEDGDKFPTIVVNLTYNDNRLNKDKSTYIDNVTMDSDEE